MNLSMLIYEAVVAFAPRSEPDATRREAYLSAWPRYTKALQDAGVFVTGSGLQLPDTATTLTLLEHGERRVQDGPMPTSRYSLAASTSSMIPTRTLRSTGLHAFRPCRAA